MRTFFRKIAVAALAAALILPKAGVTTYAKTATKLSKKSITMTDAGKTYSLKLKTSAKKSKISWTSTINAGTAKDAEPCIDMVVSRNRKKVTIHPIMDGSGQIICTVGSKKYKCKYKVKIPVKVESKFSDFAGHIQQNSTNQNGFAVREMGTFKTSDAQASVYAYFIDDNSIKFESMGFYPGKNDYFNVSFILTADGNVKDVSVDERVESREIYTSKVSSRQASAFNKGCTKVSFATIPNPGVTQSYDSCEKMAQKKFDETLQCINKYLTSTLGYNVRNIGFVNYK